MSPASEVSSAAANAATRPADEMPALVIPDPGILPDLVLIGLIALLAFATAVTAAHQWQQRSRRDRLAIELTAAASAFQTYFRVSGKTPPDASAGELPSGPAAFLTGADWTSPTPAGGRYRWVQAAPDKAARIAGRIMLVAFPPAPPLKLSRADLLEIDRRIDDGDLATGDFQTGFNGWPTLTVRTP